MKLGSWVVQYLIAAAVLVVLDLIWLTLVAADLYRRLLGDLLASDPNPAAAVLFYAIFLFGLVYFAIRPALEEGSMTRALVAGAILGLVTYATWDLTNLAVIAGFPAALVPIDLAWGTALAASVSGATYRIYRLGGSFATPRR